MMEMEILVERQKGNIHTPDTSSGTLCATASPLEAVIALKPYVNRLYSMG